MSSPSLTQHFSGQNVHKHQPTEINFLLISIYVRKIIHWKTTKENLMHLAPNVNLNITLGIKLIPPKMSIQGIILFFSTIIQCLKID